MIIIESVPKCIFDHGIYHGCVTHTISVTSLRNCVRSHGHVLHTTCYYDVSVACHDHLCSLVHTVQTGTTYHVHGNCGNFNGKSCLDCSLTCYVLSLTCLDNTSHIYLVNCFGSNACSLQSLLDHDSAQLRCRSCA